MNFHINHFKAIHYPRLEHLTDFNISLLTNTQPLLPIPIKPPSKNPITSIPTSSGYSIFWGFASTLSNKYIDKTDLSISKSSITTSPTSSTSLQSQILSISSLESLSEILILVETANSFHIFDLNLTQIQAQEAKLKDIHSNPFYPNQIAYLTEKEFSLVNKSNFAFACEGYNGFEFQFSPFLITFYNSSTISLRDMRQEKEIPIHTGNDILQVLPIDCCYSMAVLGKELMIYDCRYWDVTHKYTHVHDSENWFLMEFPQRSSMYADGKVSQTHQKIYGKSNYIEEYSHNQKPLLEELMSELTTNPYYLPSIINSINSFPLLAAVPITVNNKEIWLQTSENGGLFIESKSAPDSFFANCIFTNKIIDTKINPEVTVFDRKEFLENVIGDELKIPFSARPSLLLKVDPDFEDFEDF